ncbi:MAG TPA: YihY family inner membrane protein [Xanthomonadaceae bacterium]|nr:YihY family inner membrane protein [Xanthomonadaceae bacterium]
MRLRETIGAWIRELDRDRIHAFGRFLWKRFLDDRCFETAGALSFATVFALVPLTTAVFGVVAAFPEFEAWQNRLTEFVFANFVPAAARAVEQYLLEFAGSARGLSTVGAAALLITAVVVMANVEETFNRIWRVKNRRPPLARFLVYWVVLTLGPILVFTGLALSSYFMSLPLLSDAGQDIGLGQRLLRLLPTVIEVIGFTLMYVFIPNRTVPWRHAIAAGVLAAVLFEASKSGFAFYLTQVPTYRQVYGAVAVAPIFLIWVYLSWSVVLLGASFAASLGAFRYQPAALRLPAGYEFFGLLRLVGRFREAQHTGTTLDTEQLHDLEPCLTDDLLQGMLGDLAVMGVIRRSETGGWLLARDLEHLTLGELYEGCTLRVPVAEAVLPCRDDPLGQAAAAALDAMRLPLRDHLRHPVATVYRSQPRNTETQA